MTPNAGGRKNSARSTLFAIAVLAALVGIAVATVHSQKPDLNEAIRQLPMASESSDANVDANITAMKSTIHKYGDSDPEAATAYYTVGIYAQQCLKYSDAVVSFDRCLALPSPPDEHGSEQIHRKAYLAKFQAVQFIEAGGARIALSMFDHPKFSDLAFPMPSRGSERQDLLDRIQYDEDPIRQQRNLAAQHTQIALFHNEPKWSHMFANGEEISLVGIVVSRGHTVVEYTPSGHMVGSHTYESAGGAEYGPLLIGGTAGTYKQAVALLHVVDKAPSPRCAFALDVDTPTHWHWGSEDPPTVFMRGQTFGNGSQLYSTTNGLRPLQLLVPAESHSCTLYCGIGTASTDVSNDAQPPWNWRPAATLSFGGSTPGPQAGIFGGSTPSPKTGTFGSLAPGPKIASFGRPVPGTKGVLPLQQAVHTPKPPVQNYLWAKFTDVKLPSIPGQGAP